MSKLLEQFIQEEYKSRQTPDFRVGDIVRVHQIVPDIKVDKKLSKTAKAVKKSRGGEQQAAGQRTQIFEGVVIARKHGTEPGASFTVRKIASHNIGVEKIFPLYSPLVTKIEVSSRPTKRPRRAKLYFLRSRTGKKARRFGVGQAVEQKVMSVEQTAGKTEPGKTSDEVDGKTPDVKKEGGTTDGKTSGVEEEAKEKAKEEEKNE